MADFIPVATDESGPSPANPRQSNGRGLPTRIPRYFNDAGRGEVLKGEQPREQQPRIDRPNSGRWVSYIPQGSRQSVLPAATPRITPPIRTTGEAKGPPLPVAPQHQVLTRSQRRQDPPEQLAEDGNQSVDSNNGGNGGVNGGGGNHSDDEQHSSDLAAPNAPTRSRSGPLRQRLGPARRVLQEHMLQSVHLLEELDLEPREQRWLSRAKGKAVQLERAKNNLEKLDKEWTDLINQLQGEEMDAEMRYYEVVQDSSRRNLGVNDALVEAEAVYSELLSAIATEETDLEQSRRTSIVSVAGGVAPGAGGAPRIEAPKVRPIKVAPFSGERRDYWTFKAMFDALIHRNTSLSGAEKMQHLREALREGTAARLIDRIDITDANYLLARQLLEDRYGDERELVRDLHHQLTTLKSPLYYTQLDQFHAEVEAICTQLQTMGYPTDTDSRLLDELEAKLPRQTLLQVLEEKDRMRKAGRGTVPARWTMVEFRQVLKEIVRREEIVKRTSTAERLKPTHEAGRRRTWRSTHAVYCESGTEDDDQAEEVQRNATHGAENETEEPSEESESGEEREDTAEFVGLTSSTPRCVFACKGHPGHWSSDCPTYVSRAQRRRRLMELKFCWRCFKAGHIARACKARVQCQKCQSKEHKRPLCPMLEEESEEAQAAKREAEKTLTPAMKKGQAQWRDRGGRRIRFQPLTTSDASDEEEGPRHVTYSTHASIWPTTVRTLMMVRIALAVNPNNIAEQLRVLIFMDNGSGVSFITEKARQRLKLTAGLKLKVYIDRFNDQAPGTIDTEQVAVGIRTKKGSLLTLKMLTVDNISKSMVYGEVNESEMARLRVEGEFPVMEMGEPDILIGGDHWNNPLRIRLTEYLPSGFAIYDSLLGPVLHGCGPVTQREAQHGQTISVNVGEAQRPTRPLASGRSRGGPTTMGSRPSVRAPSPTPSPSRSAAPTTCQASTQASPKKKNSKGRRRKRRGKMARKQPQRNSRGLSSSLLNSMQQAISEAESYNQKVTPESGNAAFAKFMGFAPDPPDTAVPPPSRPRVSDVTRRHLLHHLPREVRQKAQRSRKGVGEVDEEAVHGRVQLHMVNTKAVFGMKVEAGDVENQLRRYFTLEGIGLKSDPVKESDQEALENFQRTVHIDETGRIVSALPWVNPPRHPPSNEETAHVWLDRLWRKLSKNMEHLMAYHNTLMKHATDKVLLRVNPKAAPKGHVTYLMHFAVPKKNGSPRVVFAANWKAKRGDYSLNDCLLRGPIELEEVPKVLTRTRLQQILVSGDIEGAFHQIAVREEDQDSLRCLWLIDPTKPPTPDNIAIYRFARVVFGVVSSPSMLGMAIKYALSLLGEDDRRLVEMLIANLYVDNLFLLGESEEQMERDVMRTCEIFSQFKMNVREFISNKPQLLDSLAPERRLPMKETKLLGIWWDPTADTYSIKIKPPTLTSPTRRELCSAAAKVYDPLGWISPVMLSTKLLLQKVAQQGDWDEIITQELIQEWQSCVKQWNRPQITLPRYIPLSSPVRLHVFTDASSRALAVAAYLSTATTSHLLMARSRVKPSDWKFPAVEGCKFTPQMELAAIELGTRVLTYLVDTLKIHMQGPHTLWTDSEVSLHWLNSWERKPTFIENRCRAIRSIKGSAIRFTPGDANPADLGTRGCSAAELEGDRMWWEAPPWLPFPARWPKGLSYDFGEDTSPFDFQESGGDGGVAATVAATAESEYSPLMEYTRVSAWPKLVRIVGYMRRLLNTNRSKPAEWTLTIPELIAAKRIILLDVQKSGIDKHPHLLPYLDPEDGLWRVGGRLENAPIAPAAQHPIILPRKHHVTKLIIQDIHRNLQHAGYNLTCATLRKEYWVPSARGEAKAVVRECPTCRRCFGPAFQPRPQPPLPSPRVSNDAPFTHVGLDYWGPVSVRQSHLPTGAEILKVWVAIFTCLSIRAVNMEVVVDNSARTFLLALRRHMAKHDVPATILSDNGTNFILGRKALALVQKGKPPKSNRTEEDLITNFCVQHSIRWETVVEEAPNRAGATERMVGLTKRSISTMITRSRLPLDAFETLILETCTIVNSRPITYLSDDVRDPFPLTPLDFLRPRATARTVGGIGVEHPVHGQPVTPGTLKDMWDGLNYRLDRFWESWSTEYLTGLLDRRTKTRALTFDRPPQLGEVVLVEGEPLQPRGKWPIARIMELIKSKDGEERTAVVQLGPTKRRVRRAIEQLHPLEYSPASGHQVGKRSGKGSLNLVVTSLILLLTLCPITARPVSVETRRFNLEDEEVINFKPWRVVGETAGIAIVKADEPPLKLTLRIEVNSLLRGMPDEKRWDEKLRNAIALSIPEIKISYNSTHSSTNPVGSRRARAAGLIVVGGGTLVTLFYTGYSIYREWRMDQKMKELGNITEGAIAQVDNLQLEAEMNSFIEGMAKDWQFISTEGRAAPGFWEARTEKEMVNSLNLTNPDCYRVPRVLNSITGFRLAPEQRWPILELEASIPVIEDCGLYGRELRHVGLFDGRGYGQLDVPAQAFITPTTLTGVAPTACNQIAINTYDCMVERAAYSIHTNNTCTMRGEETSCRALTRNLSAPCWAEIATNEDHHINVFSTTCPEYHINEVRYPLTEPTQIAIRLGKGQILRVGEHTIHAHITITARIARMVTLNWEEDEPQVRWLRRSIREWMQEAEEGKNPLDWLVESPWISGGLGVGTVSALATIVSIYLKWKNSNSGTTTNITVRMSDLARNEIEAEAPSTPQTPRRSNRRAETPPIQIPMVFTTPDKVRKATPRKSLRHSPLWGPPTNRTLRNK